LLGRREEVFGARRSARGKESRSEPEKVTGEATFDAVRLVKLPRPEDGILRSAHEQMRLTCGLSSRTV
jgi:hypothetical protein